MTWRDNLASPAASEVCRQLVLIGHDGVGVRKPVIGPADISHHVTEIERGRVKLDPAVFQAG